MGHSLLLSDTLRLPNHQKSSRSQNRRKKVLIGLFCLKWAILCFSLVLFDRWNCVDRCIQERFTKRFNRNSLGGKDTVVDRDWFSPTGWNTTYLMRTIEDDSIYKNIKLAKKLYIPEIVFCFRIDQNLTDKIRSYRNLFGRADQ